MMRSASLLLLLALPSARAQMSMGPEEEEMLEEVNAVCPSTGVTISVHNSLVNSLIGKWCSDAQKKQYFPKLVTGEWLGAYCLSEAFSGSDAAALRCR